MSPGEPDPFRCERDVLAEVLFVRNRSVLDRLVPPVFHAAFPQFPVALPKGAGTPARSYTDVLREGEVLCGGERLVLTTEMRRLSDSWTGCWTVGICASKNLAKPLTLFFGAS